MEIVFILGAVIRVISQGSAQRVVMVEEEEAATFVVTVATRLGILLRTAQQRNRQQMSCTSAPTDFVIGHR